MTGSQSSEQFDYLIQAQVRQADLIACKTLQDSLQQAALQSKGYLGQETFCRQLENDFIEYNVRLRFSYIQSCLAWIDSPIRRRYLHQAESRFVHQFRSGIHEPSFDLWLTSQLPDPPPIWKMNLLVWLALYPSVMLLSLISVHSLGRLPSALNVLASTAITVALTGWLLVPRLARVYRGWLETQSQRLNLAGSGSILALPMVCYAIFSAPNVLNLMNPSVR